MMGMKDDDDLGSKKRSSSSPLLSSFNSADEVDPAPIKKNAIPDAKKSWKSHPSLHVP